MNKHGPNSYLSVAVYGNDLEKAIRLWKKKLQTSGMLRTLKFQRFFEKPGEKRRRKQAETKRRAIIQARRLARKHKR